MARWVILVAAFALSPRIAAAEEADEQSAFQAFERGTRLFDAEDYFAAAEQFEEALRLAPSPSVHYNIARSYELAEEPGLAIEHYREFIEARVGSPNRRRQVQRRLTALEQRIGWVVFDSRPQRVAIIVDGRERGTTPLRIALSRGEHEIEARGEGSTALQVIQVGPGEREIFVTLEQRETTPPEPDDPDDPDEPQTFRQPTVPDSENGRSDSAPRSVRRLHHAFFWSSLGLTLTSGVLLAVYGVELLDRSEEYNNLPDGDPREEELFEQGRTLEAVTTGLWIATGVLTCATVLFAIFTDWGRLRRRDREVFSFNIRGGLRSVSLELNF